MVFSPVNRDVEIEDLLQKFAFIQGPLDFIFNADRGGSGDRQGLGVFERAGERLDELLMLVVEGVRDLKIAPACAPLPGCWALTD
jgi:hypothetical protein